MFPLRRLSLFHRTSFHLLAANSKFTQSHSGMSSQKLDYPAAIRNSGPILEQLRAVVAPSTRFILEIGSGSGQHAQAFASALPNVTWQPSSMEAQERASIDAYCDGLRSVRPALDIDTTTPWAKLPRVQALGVPDVIVSINMVHIAPWQAAIGLFEGAGALLSSGGLLFMYGPYKFNGSYTAPSNEQFDTSLRSRNPLWGVRDVVELEGLANANGLRKLGAPIPLPANNHVLLWRKE